MNKKGPFFLYLHPWEFDENTPRVPLPFLSKAATYYGIRNVFSKMEGLLKRFSFSRMDDVLSRMGASGMKDPGKQAFLLIPAYNEESRIASVIRGVKERYPSLEVVVIDDGSKDETRRQAMEAGARVISHPYNLGYGVALQTGYKYALKEGYEALVQMDGDGQHDPSYIPSLLNLIQKRRRGSCHRVPLS